jgi:hypothetical protein
MKLLFLLSLLLARSVALAQQAVPLPDAPSAVLAKAALRAESEDAVRFDAEGVAAAESKGGIPGGEGFGRELNESSGDRESAADSEPHEQGEGIDLGALLRRMNRPSGSYVTVDADGNPQPVQERYHWKGLLWESFAFFGVQNTQRLLADSYFRELTADKPFWHDYIASAGQWNWRRWDDGDDFLVAYVAHPLQGSVTEFIEIQNNPRTRGDRISDGKAYWKSRMQAMLWATAYSFDQKLGPLGETALGSEGGYTYVVGCSYYCSAYFANPSAYKVTNNTGWVKLVSTPVAGTLWTVIEDALDHLVSDRVQGDRVHATFPRILRSSLNPAHTMANFLRWRLPWYRDWQGGHSEYLTPREHLLPGDDAVILAEPMYQFFPHFVWIKLPVNTQSCSWCRQSVSGYGFDLTRRIATYADLDGEWNYLANASPLPSDRAGGNAVTATFGLRSGYTSKYYSVKVYLRPGFLSYGRAYEASPSANEPIPPLGRITHFSVALGVDADVYVNRHLGFRGVIGNQPVRYREAVVDPPGIGTYPYLNWLSKQYFLTNENWMYEMGTVLRF